MTADRRNGDRRPDDRVAREHLRVGDWDAAYVLGSLDADDRRAFERHLAECDRCRDAVADLAGLPGLLSLVPADEALATPDGTPEAEADVVDLAAVAARIRHDRARRRWTATAVAASLLVVGGGVGWAIGGALSDAHSPASAAQPTGPTGTHGTDVALGAVDGSGVTAQLTLEPVAWGTRLTWSCSYPDAASSPYPAATYALVMVDDDGTATTVATWAATGTGAHGLSASTHLDRADVRRVEIRAGTTVLATGTA